MLKSKSLSSIYRFFGCLPMPAWARTMSVLNIDIGFLLFQACHLLVPGCSLSRSRLRPAATSRSQPHEAKRNHTQPHEAVTVMLVDGDTF